jgi:sec-independent protein translocase protein TatA
VSSQPSVTARKTKGVTIAGFLSPSHVVLLLIVALLLFGAKRLPELGRSLGTGMREFKHSLDVDSRDERPALAAAPAPAPAAAVGRDAVDAVETRPAA